MLDDVDPAAKGPKLRVAFVYRETFWTEGLRKDRYEYYRVAPDLPLGLASVRSFAQSVPAVAAGTELHNRVYPDTTAEAEAVADIVELRPDVAAFSVYLWNSPSTLRMARALKRRLPGLVIVLGGPEVPRDAEARKGLLSRNSSIDVAVGGEGEEPFAEVLRARLKGAAGFRTRLRGVRGIAFRDGRAIRVTPGRSVITDLSRIPSPYVSGAASLVEGARGMVTVETSRGCPFSCAFCDYHAGGRRVRRYPVERLSGEIDLILSRGFQGLIYVADPILNLDPDRTVKVFGQLARCRNRIQLELKPELLDDPSIRALGRIAFPWVALGIQSINPKTLENIGRRLDLDRTVANIRKLMRLRNINIFAEFIIGLPGDDYEWMKRSMDWALRFAPALNVTAFDLVLLPNSPLAGMQERFRLEVDEEGLVQSCCSFSRQDLVKTSQLFAAYFYLRDQSGRYPEFLRAVRRPGQRPSDALEKVAALLVKQGLIPGRERVIGQGGRRRGDGPIPGGPASGSPRWVELSRLAVGMEGESWW